jgi:O-antigen ligase
MLVADRLIFALTLLLFSMLTIFDGARNAILFLSISGGFLVLLGVWLVLCRKVSELLQFFPEYKAVFFAWTIWLLLTWFQAYGLFGLDSVNPYQTYIELYLYIGYGALFVLLIALLRSPARILWLVSVILAVAGLQTIFGMVNFYSESAVFGWAPTHYALKRVTGSYVNRNFYANLVAMSAGFPLIWALTRSRTENSLSSAHRYMHGGNEAIALALLLILLSGLMLSGSRAAVVSFAGAAFFVFFLVLRDKRLRISIAGLLLTGLASFVFFGAQLMGQRFLRLQMEASDRLGQWKTTLGLINGSKITGFGAGSYEAVFRSRPSGELGPMTYNHAHNDYLELILEQGAVGLFLLGVIVCIPVWKSLHKLYQSRSLLRKRLILSGLFGASVILLHALVDFPFQVPANMWFFIALLSIVVSATRIDFRTPPDPT